MPRATLTIKYLSQTIDITLWQAQVSNVLIVGTKIGKGKFNSSQNLIIEEQTSIFSNLKVKHSSVECYLPITNPYNKCNKGFGKTGL